MPLSFSAHLGYLFADLPLERRFAAARAAGFEAVEHPAPFAIAPADLRGLLDENGLRLVQITSGLGKGAEKGIASLPGREAEFRDGFARALDYAEAVGCGFVHPMAGLGGDAAAYRANLDMAVRLAEGRGPRVLVEAISATAVPGYFMAHVEDLLALAQGFDGRIKLLIDSFHAKADGHDPAEAILAAGSLLGHVHIADFPGRHEPSTGVIDFTRVLAALDEIGFLGAIGFEYLPSGADHLSWLPEWQRGRANLSGVVLRRGAEAIGVDRGFDGQGGD
jgi:hydroxypyruvate isomerase